MASPQRQAFEATSGPVERLFRPKFADEADHAITSPARALQQQVEDAFSGIYPEPHVSKLHPGVRLALICGLTVGTWTAILAAGRSLFHL